MLYKEDWDKAKERLEALWENEIVDRCCIAVTAPKASSNYKRTPMPQTEEELRRFYTDPEWILQRSISRFENHYYGGEAFPSIWPNFGTAGHAKYFNGCKYKFTKDTVWYEPHLEELNEEKLIFEPNNPAYLKEKGVMKYLSEAGKGKFFVSMPDNCGIMDSIAHLRDSSNLLLDMIEDPEGVKSARDKVLKVVKDTSEEMLDIIYENNDNGSTHGWMNTWSKGKHLQLQCDISVMVSPQMYEEFLLPELEGMTQWLDHAIYHFDGQEQIRHLDLMLSVKKINMIQWTPVAGQPPTSDFIPVLQRIQKAGRGLILYPQLWEVDKLLTELSPKGLMLVLNNVKSESDAKELVKRCYNLTANR
jgi:hypothetical protein